MSKLRYTEQFFSLQGEGRYVGVPSVFLRMFGCNFRCKNFNRYSADILGDEVKQNPEVVEVIKNISLYKTLEDLPLVSTGCDSYPSVYPEFKALAHDVDAATLAQQLVDLLPSRRWEDEHLVITGGEPLLGWQRAYPALLDHPLMYSLKEITFETNGTQAITPEFKKYLIDWESKPEREITFSVSPKLSCSGESRGDAIKPEVVCSYQELGWTGLKFVVANDADVDEAIETADIYRAEGFTGPIYLMPVGGVNNVYQLNNRRVAELALQNGLRYSPRLHIDLYGNAWNS